MSGPIVTLAQANADAIEARRRVSATSNELLARLNPTRLARDVRARVEDAGSSAARVGIAGARRNAPALIAAGAVAALLLARRQLGGAFRRHQR